MRRHGWTSIASTLALVAGIGATSFAADSWGPGADSFTPVGRFVFRNEAEAIARKIAATRADLQEPIQIVEATLEAVPGAPGGRGWNIVVVAKVTGGCHLVKVGLTSREGKVYRVTDERALPAKAPPDCERWFILGGLEAPAAAPVIAVRTPHRGTPARTPPPETPVRTTTPPRPRPTPTPKDAADEMPIESDEPVVTATPAPTRTAAAAKTPPGTAEAPSNARSASGGRDGDRGPAASPTRTAFAAAAGDATPAPAPRVKRGRPPNQLTREEVIAIATELAAELGWTEIEPKLSDLTGGRWRQDVLGRTKKGKGCGAYKLELTSPEWTMRYQIETTRAKSIGECREWYVREARGETDAGWEDGEVDW